MSQHKEFEIWSEGACCTGDEGKWATPFLHGKVTAESFKEACILLAARDAHFNINFNKEKLTFWGCRLFSNEYE